MRKRKNATEKKYLTHKQLTLFSGDARISELNGGVERNDIGIQKEDCKTKAKERANFMQNGGAAFEDRPPARWVAENLIRTGMQ